MKKDVLKAIKNDMWEVLSNKKYLQAEIKDKLKEIEERRKEALADVPEGSWMWQDMNKHFDRMRVDAIWNLYERWHNDQSYYLIYKDGSCVCISAEEILGGTKFPKVSDVVYAQMQSADDDMDTEMGDRDFYSEERLKACDYDYGVEDERKEQYELAIEIKFGTEFGNRYMANHPGYQPVAI